MYRSSTRRGERLGPRVPKPPRLSAFGSPARRGQRSAGDRGPSPSPFAVRPRPLHGGIKRTEGQREIYIAQFYIFLYIYIYMYVYVCVCARVCVYIYIKKPHQNKKKLGKEGEAIGTWPLLPWPSRQAETRDRSTRHTFRRASPLRSVFLPWFPFLPRGQRRGARGGARGRAGGRRGGSLCLSIKTIVPCGRSVWLWCSLPPGPPHTLPPRRRGPGGTPGRGGGGGEGLRVGTPNCC